MKQTGKVWLLGAGPGDAGLLTVKGKQVLQQAQVIICDAQAGSSILALLPKEAEKIYVGASVGAQVMTQEEIHALLVQKARAGLRVVRLYAGNPFLFGTGGEELLALQKSGVAYEVLPSVSSIYSAFVFHDRSAAQRGIPASVHIVSGQNSEKRPFRLPYDAYADVGGTLVFLVSLSALRDIVNGLLRAGMGAHTPAVVLEKEMTGRQRKVCATLETILEETQRADLQTSTAMMVVGADVHISEALAGQERLPLFGRRFVLTRAAEQFTSLVEELRVRGAEVFELPVTETQPTDLLEKQPYIIEETANKHFDCLVFSSPAGVKNFFDSFFAADYDARALAGVRLAALGSGTGQALRAYGLRADLTVQTSGGKASARALTESLSSGSRIALLGSSVGNQRLTAAVTATAQEMGKIFTLVDIPIYHTVLAPREPVPFLSDAELENTDGIFFTSASAVRAFLQQHPQADAGKLTALCSGAATARAAQEAGMCVQLAESASAEGLLALAEQLGGNF